MCATVKKKNNNNNKGHLCRSLVPGAGMPRDSVFGLGMLQLVVALAPPQVLDVEGSFETGLDVASQT